MDIRSTKIVFFSPTETTARIVNRIAQGIRSETVSEIDLTPPEARSQETIQIRDEFTIIGTPVYAGRVPPEAVRRLRGIKGNNTPAAIVVVYGNREYEDALLELSDIAIRLGFRPIAGGTFIGEHSYHSETTPIAPGRPDDRDMEKAKRFGELIREKMNRLQTLDDLPALKLPGNFPYKKWDHPSEIAPVTLETLCILCGECASVCPTAAITVGDSVITQKNDCIHCSACVKRCPTDARRWESAFIGKIRKWLIDNCRQRKEPENYL
jgi:ferredoxin/protein involved in ribonucleotide reduction